MVGIGASVWAAVLGLVVVPIYLRYLGMEAYGLIAFFTSAQSLLQLLDMGLVPTMNREVARASGSGNLEPARGLLHSLSIVYWITAIILGTLIVLLSPFISRHWLRATSMPQETVAHTVMLMGVVVACRWPTGIYQGAIMGAQRMLVSSVINIVVMTLGSLGTITLFAIITPKIEIFFIWQAAVGVLYAFTLRASAWKIIGSPASNAFDWSALRRVWRFSAGMSGVAVTGIILMQIDKVLLSRILSLKAFGAYALATALSAGLYVLLTPTFNVVYPRLSAMVATEETDQLIAYYRIGTRFLLSVLFPLAIFISIYSKEIVYLWTRDASIASNAAPILSIFIVGSAFNGVMHFPYALQLAYGKTRLPLKINLILLSVTIPTTVVLANRFGAMGGAASWATVNAVYFAVGTWLTHKSLLKGLASKWITMDVGIPLLISILIGGGFGLTNEYLGSDPLKALCFGVVSCIITTASIVAASQQTRMIFVLFYRKYVGIRAS